jgi:hypothetical protein
LVKDCKREDWDRQHTRRNLPACGATLPNTSILNMQFGTNVNNYE